MFKCENCKAELIKIPYSKFLTCKECGLISNILIFEEKIKRKKEEKKKIKNNNKKISLKYTLILNKLKIPKKYKKKINNRILKIISEENLSKKEIYKIIRKEYSETNNKIQRILKKAKKYINISKVFLSGCGMNEIHEAIIIIYYMKKKNIPFTYEQVAKYFGIAKNNLFRRYKEFEKKIKIYEKLGLKRLLILKNINQKRLKELSLSDLSLICNIKYSSIKSINSRVKKMIKGMVNKSSIIIHLISNHKRY